MKFKYKKYSPTVLRPVIPIELAFNGKSIKYEVLVDSGADINIFDAEIADILGIDMKFGATDTVTGITGVAKTFFICSLDLIVGGHEFKNVEAGFLPEFGAYGYGVVGQKGFFDKFAIKFELSKKEIELKPQK